MLLLELLVGPTPALTLALPLALPLPLTLAPTPSPTPTPTTAPTPTPSLTPTLSLLLALALALTLSLPLPLPLALPLALQANQVGCSWGVTSTIVAADRKRRGGKGPQVASVCLHLPTPPLHLPTPPYTSLHLPIPRKGRRPTCSPSPSL